MSWKGNPYDNAFAESFLKTLKQEEVYLWQYESYDDVIKRVPYFMMDVYNKKRLHSATGLQRNTRVYWLRMSLRKVR
jgi:putative transposase